MFIKGRGHTCCCCCCCIVLCGIVLYCELYYGCQYVKLLRIYCTHDMNKMAKMERSEHSFLPLSPLGLWDIVIISNCLCVCLSFPQHFVSIQYLINAYVGKKLRNILEDVNAFSFSSMHNWRKVVCYLIMPLGVT